ncbi:PKD domain-containing protein [Thalassolituus maritimus]|uniref:Calx-beta domain-containing protein n=1 Tax=Thalassolituus maritimus TaxID=484498 RepID=A0ABP9ZXU3_9GAMM
MKLLPISAIATAILAGTSLSASASLFDDAYNSYWVINEDTGEITGYSSGDWEQRYRNALYVPASNEQVLVNALAASSTPMSASLASPQPLISVIGLQEVNVDSSTAELNISPASGAYEQTVRVVMEAGSTSSADQLQWRVNEGAWQSVDIDTENRSAAATFIENGAYTLEVELLQGGTLATSAQMLYTVASDHPLGKQRDTDNDGIPDIVEAELGLNALSEDADVDRDGDGWSDIDTYIRCGVVTQAEIDAQPEADRCTALNDDDEDGWSNFDEELRGTRVDDPVAVLSDTYGDVDSEAYYQEQQRYRQFPAARRLYEREYLIQQNSVPAMLLDLQATTFSGDPVWNVADLISADELSDAGLSSGDVEPELVASTVALVMESTQIPEFRAPASSGLFLRGESLSSLRTSMTYLPPVGDASFAEFSSDLDAAGDWASASEWRDNLVKWLGKELVIAGTPGFDDTTTLSLLMLEQALRDEADEREEGRLLELGNSERPAPWLDDWLNEHRERFPVTEPEPFTGTCFFRGDTFFADGCEISVTSFAKLILEMQASLEGALASDSAAVQRWIADIPVTGEPYAIPGNAPATLPVSDWISEQLKSGYTTRLTGCYISDYELSLLQEDAEGLAAFEARCPEYYTDSDLYNEQLVELNMRQRLRLALLPNGLRELSIDTSLGEFGADSDADGLSNWDELTLFSTTSMPLPWYADSDTDGLDDVIDQCPADSSNTCYGDQRSNTIALETSETQIFQRLNGDSSAIVAVQLERPALADVCVMYELTTAVGTPDLNETGEVCFRTGQSIALISVTLPDDGSNEAATLQIVLTDINDTGDSGLYDLGDDLSQELAFEPAEASERPTAIAAISNESADERSTVELQGNDSTAADDNGLTYQWQQIAGPDASISDASGPNSELILPEVLENTDLGFRLTVTDSQGATASADVSVTVLPVEDAPEQTAVPTYILTADAELILTPEQLKAYLREPDGDPITLGELTGLPGGMNVRRESGNYVLSLTASGGIEALPPRSSRDLSLWNNGIAWISMPGNEELPFAVWGWTPENGTELLHEDADNGFGSLLTKQGSDAVYFDSNDPDTGNTLINRIEDGAVKTATAPGFNGVWGNAIDPDGGLYYCGYGGNWQILDRTTDTFSDSGVECSNYDTSALILGNRTCLSAVNTVACSAGDDSKDLIPVFTGDPNYTTSLGRLFSVGDTILLTRNVQVIEDGVYKYYIDLSVLDLDGSTTGNATTIGLMPLSNFGSRILHIDNGLVFIGQGMDANSNKVMAYAWQDGDTELTEISTDLLAGRLDDLNYMQFSEAAVMNEKVYFSITENYQDFYLFSTDAAGDLTEISINNFAGNLRYWNNRLMLNGNNGAGEGVCHWYEYTEDSGLNTNPLLQDVNCYTTKSLDDAFVFGIYDEATGGTYYNLYRMGVSPGLYSLSLSADDGKGNSTVMMIQIDVQDTGGQP